MLSTAKPSAGGTTDGTLFHPGVLFGVTPEMKIFHEEQFGPLVLVGAGLMLHNGLRFDHPLEFGQRYQLPVSAHQQFSPAFLWFNIRVGFLEPAW